METPLDQGLADQNLSTEYLQMSVNDSAAIVRKAAMWFFYIGALSLVNTFLASSGTYFIVGLAISQIVDAATMGLTGSINYSVSLIVPVLFAVIGIFAFKCQRLAFIVGAVIYILDALIYLYAGSWLALAFHAFVLYRLWVGFREISEYDEARRKMDNAL